MTPFNNLLFGTTYEGGTDNTGIIFAIGQNGCNYKQNGCTYNLLTSLAKPGGAEPHSCFVVAGNILYGMTAAGGDDDLGVIFSFDPSTSNCQTLYSFTCTTSGASMGAEPHGRPTLDPNGHTLYGMTRKGGHHGYSVVFSFDTNTNTYMVPHDFAGGASDGATTMAMLFKRVMCSTG
jgi:uncharacterized repeat protein (TIGR03803 family)